MLLYGSVMALGRYHDFANAKQQGTLETTCAEWKDWKVATRCLQHRGDVDDGIGCLGIPIHLGQAFVYQSPGKRVAGPEVARLPHCQETAWGVRNVMLRWNAILHISCACPKGC